MRLLGLASKPGSILGHLHNMSIKLICALLQGILLRFQGSLRCFLRRRRVFDETYCRIKTSADQSQSNLCWQLDM
jgi:hypothetical protein